jgi:hypothetical protein
VAKVTRSRSSSLYVRSQPPVQGGMTVWALRDFVRALDAEGVSDKTKVICDHSVTQSLTGLWVREETTEEQPAADGEQAGDDA